MSSYSTLMIYNVTYRHVWWTLFVGGFVHFAVFHFGCHISEYPSYDSDPLLRSLGGRQDPPPAVEAEEARPASLAARA